MRAALVLREPSPERARPAARRARPTRARAIRGRIGSDRAPSLSHSRPLIDRADRYALTLSSNRQTFLLNIRTRRYAVTGSPRNVSLRLVRSPLRRRARHSVSRPNAAFSRGRVDGGRVSPVAAAERPVHPEV